MAFINFGMANTLAQAKVSTNKNKLFFPTDSKKIVIDGKEYGGIDGVDIESKNSMYGVVGNGNNITDGVAAIKGIKGNTIAWNQIITPDYYLPNEFITYDGAKVIVNKDATFGAFSFINKMRQGNFLIVGHKYYFGGRTVNSKFYLRDPENNINLNDAPAKVFTATTTIFRLNIMKVPGATTDNDVEFLPMYIDLTLIYGAGNEPASVARFEADYLRWFGKPFTYEPYDAGSLRNVMMSAIKTTGFNQYNPTTGKANVFAGLTYYIGGAYSTLTINGEIIAPINRKFTPSVNGEVVVSGGDNTTVINVSNDAVNGQYKPYWNSTKSIPVTQLTGKLNGEGESVIIFPDGMKSAGNIHDEIFVDNGVVKAIKRVGAVDLGSLTWVVFSSNIFRSSLSLIKIPTNVWQRPAVCSKYRMSNNNSYKTLDKSYSFGWQTNYIYVNDTSYSDTATFKSAMSGVMLNYELAEPQVYVLDDDVLPLMYKVDELGTEQVLPECTEETPCCAPELDIRYRITPVEVLDNFSKVTNNKQVKAVADNARIEDRIVTWGSDGATIKDGGYKITDLLPTILTLEWNDNENAIVINSVSNYKQVPNFVVCRYGNLVMQMSFCDDAATAKLIGTFVATTDFIDAFETVSGITLVEDTIYLLQINVNWELVSIEGTDTIYIKTMDGTCVYPSGDDSSSSGSGSESGSEPYDDWEINGNPSSGSSISQLDTFNYVGEETISRITCCPKGSNNPVFVTSSSSGEYIKDVTWDSTNNYWEVEGGLSAEGTYVLKAYDTSYNVVSKIQIVIA